LIVHVVVNPTTVRLPFFFHILSQ